jgi:hypothetical protein
VRLERTAIHAHTIAMEGEEVSAVGVVFVTIEDVIAINGSVKIRENTIKI